jgi:hypothetical protein
MHLSEICLIVVFIQGFCLFISEATIIIMSLHLPLSRGRYILDAALSKLFVHYAGLDVDCLPRATKSSGWARES